MESSSTIRSSSSTARGEADAPFAARRRLLGAALGASCCALAGGVLSRAGHAQPVLELTEIGRGLLRVGGAGGNIVLLGDAAGVAMVDSGAPEHAERILDLIAQRFDGAPLELVLNTHWHIAHTGGNDAAGRAGARIVAHENTRLWMATEFHVDWQERTYTPRAPEARPVQTFYASDPQPLALVHGGETIEYGQLREAHTDGDIYVRFPGRNVVVAGGAVAVGRYPVVDYITGGSIDGLIGATQRLMDMSDAETLIVPGAGPVQRRADLVAQHDMLTTVRERLTQMARQGQSVAEMITAGITREFDARWGTNTERFVENAYDSIWGVGR